MSGDRGVAAGDVEDEGEFTGVGAVPAGPRVDITSNCFVSTYAAGAGTFLGQEDP
jgi:hypothetical protein